MGRRPREAPEEADMNGDPRSSRGPSRVKGEDAATTCVKCPVCGSEECLILEELGNYCSTMTAASVAKRVEEAAAKSR
jgi:hypothetical protein